VLQWSASEFAAVIDSALFLLRGSIPEKEADLNSHLERLLVGPKVKGTSFEDSLGLGFFLYLWDLQLRGMLPVIVFSFDRYRIQWLAGRLTEILEKLEERSRELEGDKGKKLAAEREKMLKKQRRLRDKAEKDAKSGKGGGKDKDDFPEDDDDANPLLQEKVDIKKFSFAGLDSELSNAEVEEMIEELAWKMGKDNLLIRALRLGVGIHHPGMPTRYRQNVEILFRARYLRVVISTSTLALGINMPCRTVTFLEDSQELTPLLYRQMAGRAGRRGMDDKGFVVSFLLPISKLSALTVSPMPVLAGQFPLSTSFVNRLLVLRNGCEDTDRVDHAIRLLLNRPLYFHGKAEQHHRDHMGIYFRVALDVLIRLGLVDRDLRSLAATPLSTLLFWFEPGNLCFAYLLSSGVIDGIIAEEDRRPGMSMDAKNEAIWQKIMHVLSAIFLVRPLHPLIRASEKGKSTVALAPLPPRAAESVDRFNGLILGLFEFYAQRAVLSLPKTSKRTEELPLSKVFFSLDRPGRKARLGDSLADVVTRSAKGVNVRTLFSAVAGGGDTFASQTDLVDSVREEVFLDRFAVPCVPMDQPRNAYALDFFNHGQLKEIISANGIPTSEAWYALNEFNSMLRTLVSALEVAVAGSDPTEDDDEDNSGRPRHSKRPISPKTARMVEVMRGLADEFSRKFVVYKVK
jgi:hypothetical protein